MYSGNSNNSNNMLYGGPLGTYLSGIYQPISSINHNVPKVNRRSSLRTGLGSNGSSGSSLYYTPQPRRRHENSDKYIPSVISGSSSYTEPTSTRLRPKSYYNPGSTNSVCTTYSRPSSMILKNNSPSKPTSTPNSQENIILDYKKLYEEEKLNNDLRRKEIADMEKEIKSNNNIIDTRKKSLDQQKILSDINFTNEIELQEFEILKNEGDKLRAENRALARVVARLSREK